MDDLRIITLELSDLIVKKEKETLEKLSWENILSTFQFSYLLKEYNLLDCQSYNNPEYCEVIGKVLNKAIEDDESNALKLIIHLLNKYELSLNEFNQYLNEKYTFYNNKELNKTVFISYSSKDEEKIDFDEIKSGLNLITFDSFIAPEDINLSQEWREKIFKQLNESSIAIAFLSKNFKESDFCSQELGIASHRNMQIIAISLDGTPSYGFFDVYQSKDIEPLLDLQIQKAIVDNHSDIMIDILIKCLGEIEFGFDKCSRVLKLLEPHYEKFSEQQINNFMDMATTNNQIYDANSCKEYLIKFCEVNNNKISNQKIDSLKTKMGL